MKITPRRTTADQALARLAAAVISRHLAPGAVVNIGIGLPEEASRILHEAGLTAGLTQTSEAGVWGGVPACGMFFGASINPERQESSSWMFHQYAERLDLACLGLLQVDSDGNVNVSRRGERPSQYVGPGGFTNIVHCARTIVFVGAFEVRPKLRLAGGRLVIDRQNRGEPKFVDHVREITFSGPQALSRGQNIWYATHVGLFHLTGRGLELVMAMPGVDIESDVLAHASARIVLPPGGIAAVATVPPEIVTGAGFHLAWDHDALDLPQEK
jgi:propionate CoA-transferase